MSAMYGNNIYLPPSPVIPGALVISNITTTNPMVVTVSTVNAYVAGQLVYFSIPFNYGMFQLNGLTGQITSIDVTNLIFTVAINATQFDQFTVPSTGEKPATLSPSGCRNIYNNLSEPFHALDGMVGN